MTDARLSTERVQVALADVTADARASALITQVAVIIPRPEPTASLAAEIVQIAMVVDTGTVTGQLTSEMVMLALQIRRGTLDINGGKRQDMIDAHERMYVTGMPGKEDL